MCLYTLLLMIPLGHTIALAFHLASSTRFYFIELIAGLLGLAVNAIFLEFLSLELFIILLLVLLPALALFELKSRSRQAVAVLMLILLAGYSLKKVTDPTFNFLLYVKNLDYPINHYNFPYKNAQESLKLGLTEPAYSKWSLSGRSDVLKSKYNSELAIYGNNSRWSTVSAKEDKDKWIFPYLQNAGSLLDIGTGGGTTLRQALNSGYEVTGVEVSDATFSLMQNQLADYTGDLYRIGNVHLSEGRRYIEETDSLFDVITIFRRSELQEEQLSGFAKNYLHTQEGIKKIFSHLNDSGYIIWLLGFSEHTKNSEELSIISTAFNNNPNSECKVLKDCMAIFAHRPKISHNPRKLDSLLIVKKAPFSLEEIEKLNIFLKENKFETVWANPHFKTFENFDLKLEEFKSELEALTKNNNEYVYSDDLPIQNKVDYYDIILSVGKWYLSTLAFIALLALTYLLKKTKREHLKEDLLVNFSSFLTGLYYGAVEMLLLTSSELYFSTPITSYILVTSSLLLGSSLCALFAKRIKPLFKIPIILLLPLLLYRFTTIQESVADQEPWPLCLLMLLIGFSLSICFVELLENQSETKEEKVWGIYILNMLGFSLAFFATAYASIQVGIYSSLRIAIGFSLLILIFGFYWFWRNQRIKSH